MPKRSGVEIAVAPTDASLVERGALTRAVRHLYNNSVHVCHIQKPMSKVNVTELRQNLPAYLAEVQGGGEIEVTVHGKVIARIVPGEDRRAAARKYLKSLRKTAVIGDLISPSGDAWDAER